MRKKWIAILLIAALLAALSGCGTPQIEPSGSIAEATPAPPTPASEPEPDEYREITVDTLSGLDPSFIDAITAYPNWVVAMPATLASLEAAPAVDETQRYRLLGRQNGDAVDVFLYDGGMNRATAMGSAGQASLAWEGGLYALQLDDAVRLFDVDFTEQPVSLTLDGTAFTDPDAPAPEAPEEAEEGEEAEPTPTPPPAEPAFDAESLSLTGVHQAGSRYVLALRDSRDPLTLLLLLYTDEGTPGRMLRVPLDEADLNGTVDTHLVADTLHITKEADPAYLSAIDLGSLAQEDLSGYLSLFFQGNLAQLSFTVAEAAEAPAGEPTEPPAEEPAVDSGEEPPAEEPTAPPAQPAAETEKAVHLRVTQSDGEVYEIDALLDDVYPLSASDTLTYDADMNKVVLTQPLQIVEFYLNDRTVGAGVNLDSELPVTEDGMYSVYLPGFPEEDAATATLYLRSNFTSQTIALDTLPLPGDALGYTFLFIGHTLVIPQLNRAYNLDSMGGELPYSVFQGAVKNIAGCIYDEDGDRFLLAVASAGQGVSPVNVQVYDRTGVLTNDIQTGYRADMDSGAYEFTLLGNSMLLMGDVSERDAAASDSVVYDWQTKQEHLRADSGLVWQDGGTLFQMGTDTPGTLELKAYDPGITGLNTLFAVRLLDEAQGLGRYNPYAATYGTDTRRLVIPPMPVYEAFFQLPPIEELA